MTELEFSILLVSCIIIGTGGYTIVFLTIFNYAAKECQKEYDMNNDKLTDLLYNNNVSFEHILHIGASLSDDSFPENNNVFDDHHTEICELLGIKEEDVDEWGLEEILSNTSKKGFVGVVKTPVPKNVGSDGSYVCSWGDCALGYVYAETFEGLCKKAVKWAVKYEKKILSYHAK